MLNANSPIVQAMLANTPNGFGNMPMYNGNAPTITTETVPVQSQSFSQSFPSPKEMLANNGQYSIYGQTSFMPQPMYQQQSYYQPMNPIIGGSPNVNAMFNGYTNPYMGNGSFMGYYCNTMEVIPIDEESRQIVEAAKFNGITYSEQLVNTSMLNKMLSRAANRANGVSEEEIQRKSKYYDIYYKFKTPERIRDEVEEILRENREECSKLEIAIVKGDTITKTSPKNVSARSMVGFDTYHKSGTHYSIVAEMWRRAKQSLIERYAYAYNHAVERKYDHCSLYEFFNGGAGYDILQQGFEEAMRINMAKRTTMVYDKNSIHALLRKSAGLAPVGEQKAMERFVGRYGVMPDGRPVSPSHDPRIAESFSYNPATGEFSVTAPNFIRDRIEKAKESFKRSLQVDG